MFAWPRRDSLLSRIVWLHVIALAALTIVLPVSLYWLLETETTSIHRSAMEEQANRLAEYLHADGDTLSLALPADLQNFYAPAYGRYIFSVVAADGAVLFTSLPDRSRIFPLLPDKRQRTFTAIKHDSATISGVIVPKTVGGRDVWIQVAEDLTNRDVLIDDVVASFFTRVAWIVFPLLLVLLVIDIMIVERALRPVQQASQDAAAIGPSQPSVRLSTANLPVEIEPLVGAINGALDRLQRSLQNQQAFTADAAHELRTPLAILRTRVETLEDKDTARALISDIEHMSRTVGQLLELAEVDSFAVDSDKRTDLLAIASDVAALLAPLAIAQGKTIAVLSDEVPVVVQGDHEMIYRAVRNLVENAIRFTVPDTSVDIDISPNGEVGVSDRGPGVSDDIKSLLFRRFWRHDRSVTGSGLGLSIVKGIAEAHGADVAVSNREGGGARFSLWFRNGGH